MKQAIAAVVVSTSVLVAAPVSAREVDVAITNLTNGTYFTPLLVAAHDRDTHLYQVGTGASANLQAMAEGGDISGLIEDVEAAGGTYVENPAGGLLAPGESTVAELDLKYRSTTHLSIVAMLLPTNDGFVGLDALKIPKLRGTYTYYLDGYDAGTEANNELIVEGGGVPGVLGIPEDPGGNSGTGATGAAGPDHNPTVHIHRSVLGDTDLGDLGGGISDLDSRVHRWLNPVARVVITVGKSRHSHDD